ncbi:MAG: acyl carrier protein [Pirellulales bacterium]
MKAAIDSNAAASEITPTRASQVLACPLCHADCGGKPLPLGDTACPQCNQTLWVMRDGGQLHLLDARQIPEEVRAWLQSVFVQLEIDRIEALDGLEADSLETLSLIMELEDAFEVRVSNPGATDIRTVGDALRYLERQLRQQHAG